MKIYYHLDENLEKKVSYVSYTDENLEKNSFLDEKLENWINNSNITYFRYSLEPDYIGEEPDNPEYSIDFEIKNDKDDLVVISVPLDGISNPLAMLWIGDGEEIDFYCDVSICDLLLKLILTIHEKY